MPTDKEIAAYQERSAIRTAPGWLPEPGTVIKATCIGRYMREDGQYDPYPVIVYRLDNGSVVSVHAFHQVLRDRLKELGTKVGSEQYLSYLGKKESGQRNDTEGKPVKYHMYDAENVGDEALKEDVNFEF